jgi:hypothetical protein
MTDPDDLPSDPFDDPPDRVRTWLIVGSVLSGTGSFVAMIWASMLLATPSEGELVIGLPVLVMMLLFVILLVACILLGYVAARRLPRT